MADLRDSDWAAYAYVERHRATFGIPEGVSFKVLPRVDATKQIGIKGPDGQYKTQRELILKGAWDAVEPNAVAALPARKRRVRTGATVAIRWDDGKVLALVRSDVLKPAQREARDKFLTALLADGHVCVEEADRVLRQPKTESGVEVRILGDVAKVSGTQRLLHIEELD